jgi:hypothetical protein
MNPKHDQPTQAAETSEQVVTLAALNALFSNPEHTAEDLVYFLDQDSEVRASEGQKISAIKAIETFKIYFGSAELPLAVDHNFMK